VAGAPYQAPVPPGEAPGRPDTALRRLAPAPGYAPPPPPNSPKGRRGLVAGMVAVFAAVAVLAGAGLGHVVWPSSTTASATQGSGATGGTTSPYGSGGELSPYGSGGAKHATRRIGLGLQRELVHRRRRPSDVSAIAARSIRTWW